MKDKELQSLLLLFESKEIESDWMSFKRIGNTQKPHTGNLEQGSHAAHKPSPLCLLDLTLPNPFPPPDPTHSHVLSSTLLCYISVWLWTKKRNPHAQILLQNIKIMKDQGTTNPSKWSCSIVEELFASEICIYEPQYHKI